jgi:O-antigen ligase
VQGDFAIGDTRIRKGGATRPRPMVPWVAYVAAAWAFFVDFLSTISLGPISVSGVATLAVAGTLAVLYPAYVLGRRTQPAADKHHEPYLPSRLEVPWAPAPLVTFAMWAVVVLAFLPTAEGVQNVAVYVAFVAAITATAASSSAGTASRVLRIMSVVAVAVALVSIVGSIFPQLLVYGDRSVALAALVLLAVVIPSTSRHVAVRFAPALLLVAMVLSLSRTATFVGVLMLPFIVVRRGRVSSRSLRILALYAAASLLLWLLVTRYAPFRDRFLVGDSFSVGGVNLNTSGRSAIWAGTLESIREGNPWVGQGPGSAAAFVVDRFPPIMHPHNEYLRLWHDFGLIGLSLFVLGYCLLMWRALKAARHSSPADASVHWSAFLGLSAVAAAAMTDNVLVYPFVMVPLGVLVGLSVARSAHVPPEALVTAPASTADPPGHDPRARSSSGPRNA